MLMRVDRRGLTLLELLAVLTILAALAAVLYPTVAVQLRKGQTAALADQLNSLRSAIANYRDNMTRYPKVLTNLTQQPVAGTQDACTNVIPNGLLNNWRGPYLAQNIVGNIVVGDATVQNTTARNPFNAAGPALLLITVNDVPLNSATDLEAQYDGNANFATGSIVYNSGTQVLTFQIPIRDC
jgi:prepilin-type N-terminal cleavage/methylation domain-containing protein